MASIAVSSSVVQAQASRASSSGSGGSELQRLQRQLAELYRQLRQIPETEKDPDRARERAQLLQAQIQLVQARIQELQRKKTEPAVTEGAGAGPAADADPAAKKNRSQRLLDTYA